MIRPALVLWPLALAAATLSAATGPWPQWRGPQRDGICRETGLLDTWPEGGPPLAWKVDGLGKGYASVAISDGRIFTLGNRRGTHLIALDEQDGRELWATAVGGGEPNCTPTVDGSLVYGLGREGDLVCCESATGKEVWRKNFPKDFGGQMMSGWGYSESPLVDGDWLVCTPGAKDAMIVALDKRTGQTVWRAALPADLGGNKGRDGAGYSSIVVSHGGGVKQYVQLTGRGVISVAAADGKFLWAYNRIANGTANIPTPLVSGDYVFCSSGYGTGAALLKLVPAAGGVQAEEVYFLTAKDMQNHHGGMVLLDGYIYCGDGHNNGFPLCVEMLTGKVAWRPGRGPGTGSAAVLYADGHLYFRYENGEMALIQATPEKYVLKSHFTLASVKGRSWPHPVIASGRLYLRDQDTLMCYDVRKR